jgi:2-haloacid dehalogenase
MRVTIELSSPLAPAERERWATFDCYGTLIDWNGGLGAAFERLWPAEDPGVLLGRYHQLEPAVQRADPSLTYREVMARCLEELAREFALPLAADSRDALGASLPSWPAFPEVPAALTELQRRGWRLAILSNSDPDLLGASVARLGVPFDRLVIASEIGSYKPSHGHWREFQSRTGACPEAHVHMGASLYHDIEPATALGIRSVWIDRLDERPETPPVHRLEDLVGLPDLLDTVMGSRREPEAVGSVQTQNGALGTNQ